MPINKVILKISPGSFEKSYGGFVGIDVPFSLPPNIVLEEKYNQWLESYDRMVKHRSYRRAVENNSTYDNKNSDRISVLIEESKLKIEECRTKSEDFLGEMNKWFDLLEFRPVREQIIISFKEHEENLLIIQTDQPQLWKLPWHKWVLINDVYPKTEVIISITSEQNFDRNFARSSSTKLEILSVTGDTTDIDVKAEQQNLKSKNSKNVNVEVKSKLSRQELFDLLQTQRDILYFCGHSSTENNRGVIQINDSQTVRIDELSESLRKTQIKIAIFNSCDNLGLASGLAKANINIPYLLLMRQSVHDSVSQKFLDIFLTNYCDEKKSFYFSVREARSKLQGLEADYPCATWLPVIFQHNSSEVAPTWNNLLKPVNSNSSKHSKASEILLGIIAFISVSVGSIFAWQNTVNKNLPETAYFWLENKSSQMALTVTTSRDNKILLTQQAIVNGKPNKSQLFTWTEEVGDSRRVISYTGLAWTVKNNIDKDKNLVVLSKDNDYPNQLFTFEKISDNWWLTIHHFQAKNTKYNRLSIFGNDRTMDTVFIRKVTDNPTTKKEEELWKIHWAQ
jgi:CHAT domain